MGSTNFPDGVSDAGKATRSVHQKVKGKATIATGLDTVEECVASLETIEAGEKKGFVVSVKPSGTAGAVDVVVKDEKGVEATSEPVVHVIARGTKA